MNYHTACSVMSAMRCLLYPQKQASFSTVAMSALCQKADIQAAIGYYCWWARVLSSWIITRETYPPTISASDRRRCCDSGFLTYCIGRNLSDAARYWS